MTKKNEEQFNIEEFIDNPQAEYDSAIEVFTSGLLPILEWKSKEAVEIIQYYNTILLIFLNYYSEFKKKIETCFYDNQELLGTHKIILKNNHVKQTVANWIYDFIDNKGTNMFSDLDIVEHVAHSKNAKKLTENEKKVLTKLLQTYRNIKFFPNTLHGNNPELWEIIPISDLNINLTKARTVSGPPKTLGEKQIEEFESEAQRYRDDSLEKLVLDEEIKKEQKLDELRFMATKHKENSLEYKAIQEEIKKVEQGRKGE